MSFDLIGRNKLPKGEKSQSLNDTSMVVMINGGDVDDTKSDNSKSNYLSSLPIKDADKNISFCINNSGYRSLMRVLIERDIMTEFPNMMLNSGQYIPSIICNKVHQTLEKYIKSYDEDQFEKDKEFLENSKSWSIEEFKDLLSEFSTFCKRSGGYYIY